MATNPMQRRAKQSFLLGFVVALVIMAIFVCVLLTKIKSLNEAKEALEANLTQVYVATDDLESGETITLADNFRMDTVQTKVAKDQVIDDTDFMFLDEDGEQIIKLNEEGVEIEKEMMMRISVPAGTIVTKDMIVETGKELQATDRIMEYNMIALPSQLKNGQYVDIRFSLPTGQDFIVLSKKKVMGCNLTTIWLQLDEFEIDLLNCAIVEGYMITGAKLYAAAYVEAGMQKATVPTYVANRETINLIDNNANIVKEAKEQYASKIYAFSTYRTDIFDPLIAENYENRNGLVESGNESELESISALRQDFVSELEGSEDIGYSKK